MAVARHPDPTRHRWVDQPVHRNCRQLGTLRRGTDENGDPITVVDQLSDTLVPLAQKQSSDPLAFIGYRQVFGDLVDDRRFVASFRKTLDSLHSVGARRTLEEVRGL